MTNEEKLKKAFTNWPTTNRFWQTNDGECFFTEPRARIHAKKIKKPSVKPYLRVDVMGDTTTATTEADKTTKAKSTKKTK